MFQISSSFLYKLVEFNFRKLTNLNTQRSVLVHRIIYLKNADTAMFTIKAQTNFASYNTRDFQKLTLF